MSSPNFFSDIRHCIGDPDARHHDYHNANNRHATGQRSVRRVAVVLLLFLLLLGCTRQEQVSQLRDHVGTLRDSLTGLRIEYQTLQERSEKRVENLAKANQLIRDVLQRLAEMTKREDLVEQMIEKAQANPENVEGMEFTDEGGSVSETIDIALSDIERQLEESQALIRQLQDKRGQLHDDLASLKSTVTVLQKRVARRESSLADLRSRVHRLTRKLKHTRERNQQLQATNDTLRERNSDLTITNRAMQTAYVVTASKDSLDRLGILDRPFLGFIGPTKVRQLDPSKFAQITTDQSRIALPEDRDDLTVFSPHRREPDLFEVQDDGLVIQDPAKFWAVSRFLIVQVEQ